VYFFALDKAPATATLLSEISELIAVDKAVDKALTTPLEFAISPLIVSIAAVNASFKA
jgi:hypothetical protein